MKALEHYVPVNDGFNVPSSPIRPSVTQASLRHQGERDGGRRGMGGERGREGEREIWETGGMGEDVREGKTERNEGGGKRR